MSIKPVTIILLALVTIAAAGSSKVYVGSLGWSTTEDVLRSAFAEFGNVLDAVVMRDRETGRSRGFGFVTFQSPEEAENAVAGMNEQELDGRRIKVNLSSDRRIVNY